jgi:pyruvate formate lyase activating enzyme
MSTAVEAGPDAGRTPPPDWRPVLGSQRGRLHSWDISTGVDGPGTRFVAFLSGCHLRCLYCQNPDTWRIRDGQDTTAAAVLAHAANFRRFTAVAGGGLTVSGGEPLMQPRFTEALLTGAKTLGFHTALDTAGFGGEHAGPGLLEHTDLVLLDVKSWDRPTFRRVTGVEIDSTVRFARRVSAFGIPIWLRFVLVPGLTDDPANVEGVARFAASLGTVERIDVLPYHRLGVAKYPELGLRYPLADTRPPDAALLARVREQFTATGLPVV